MASFSAPIKSTALAVYDPTLPHIFMGSHVENPPDEMCGHSLRVAKFEWGHLYPTTIRERILAGTYKHLTLGPGLPKPFNGTRKELLNIITATVHATVKRLDYNGNQPYLKILNQLDEKGSFRNVRIDSRNEKQGSTCVGMAHAILKNLKKQHDIDGVLAVQRKSPAHPLEHGAAIIECIAKDGEAGSDGFVLLDARSDPNLRIFSIPFGGTEQYPGFSITASHAGSTTPLTLKCPGRKFEYCTNVGNGDDLVMKHFVMHAPFDPDHPYFPIATYNGDGSDRKFIGVSLKDSIIFLKDRKAPKGTRAENIPFKFIRDNPEALHQKLQAFMSQMNLFQVFKSLSKLSTNNSFD